jgi:hypothetical protein
MTSVLNNRSNLKMINIIIILLFLVLSVEVSVAQVQATEAKYIRIGQYQNHYSAYGSERAWNNTYYEGAIWPADYPYTDNAVIKRSWIACDDFTDSQGVHWNKYGVYFAADYADDALFPVELKQTSKFPIPNVFVDGFNTSSPYLADVDEINPDQIADRIVNNVVNTSMGLTMTRRIYAFSQQYHDDYHIKEFIFKNTGNTDYDSDIELNADLKGVYVSWGTRYSVSREGADAIHSAQVYGQHSWVTRRGETYPQHYMEQLTESTPIANLDWLRCGFSWAGQYANNSFDNIGGPTRSGAGRLKAPQNAGLISIHIDKSATDKADDPNQPLVLGWHAGDTYPSLGDMRDENPMIKLYEMVSGTPYEGKGGTDRFYETHVASNPDPWTVHNDGGGTNVWISYGPFDIPFGDSIRIVEAEAVNGLSREMCERIGARWLKAYQNSSDNGPFDLPDGSTTSDKDVYKDTWFYTGWDSIMLTFSRAKRNFDSGFNIPQPPQPPQIFEVKSGGDRISLSWSPSESEGDPNFGGYKVYRAIGRYDTTYQEIYACGKGTGNPLTNNFDDTTPVRGFSYFYYLVAFTDGSLNSDGILNPTGELQSSRFYTKTTRPAYLQRKWGESLKDIRIVPNPYNVVAQKEYAYIGPGNEDKIAFLNVPAFCKIKIYTERGDLIETINHTDGSGDEYWTSLTTSRQVIVSGLYIAYFEVTKDFVDPGGKLLYKKGENTTRKFIIIR